MLTDRGQFETWLSALQSNLKTDVDYIKSVSEKSQELSVDKRPSNFSRHLKKIYTSDTFENSKIFLEDQVILLEETQNQIEQVKQENPINVEERRKALKRIDFLTLMATVLMQRVYDLTESGRSMKIFPRDDKLEKSIALFEDDENPFSYHRCCSRQDIIERETERI